MENFEKFIEEAKKELVKLNAQIKEIEGRRDSLIRKSNEVIYGNKAQAEKIIADAQAEAEKILLAAKEQLEQNEEEETRLAGEWKELQAREQILKDAINTNNEAQKRIEKDQETRHKEKTEELNSLESNLSKRKLELDGLEIDLKAKETNLANKSEVLARLQESLVKDQGRLGLDRAGLDKAIVACNKDKELVENQRLANEQALSEIKISQDKIASDSEKIAKDTAGIDKDKTEISEQKKKISAQFNLIEVTQKELKERTTTLDEKNQLLIRKDREISDKIRTLHTLRAKNGAQ